MISWIHRLFNPHCEHCALQRDQELILGKRCNSCDALQIQVEYLRADNQRLMDIVLGRLEQPITQPQVQTSQTFQPINHMRGWPQMRRELELKDKLAFEQLKKARKENPELETEINADIAELEKETGVSNA